MSGRQTTLWPGEWAVLGPIAERPRHGFAIRKALGPAEPSGLLAAQRGRVEPIAASLAAQARTSEGFDRTQATWRLETARAAVRFLDRVAAGAISAGEPPPR